MIIRISKYNHSNLFYEKFYHKQVFYINLSFTFILPMKSHNNYYVKTIFSSIHIPVSIISLSFNFHTLFVTFISGNIL